MEKKLIKQNGAILVYLLVIIFIFSVMMLGVINLLTFKMKVLGTTINKEQSLQIAEAGINYYQWHLAHYPSDYKDGTENSGPYIHDYVDLDTQKTIGQFSLTITPPSVGSTIVTIQSTGWSSANPNIKKTVTAKYGIPSLAQYSFISNDIIWIGSNESVNGQMQSNNGIRFDGIGNAPIQSAKSTYMCSPNQGNLCPTIQNGVWGSASQAVKNFWQFPVPAVDFSSLTSNLASMKSLAQSAGIYLPPSNADGYSLVFNSDGTVSIYTITKLQSTPPGSDVNGATHNEDIDYKNRSILSGYPKSIPTNGIIYIEDNIWVEGTVKGKVMVAAAILPQPATPPTIYIPNNILYAAKDGTNVLGLLAQKDIVVTYGAPGSLEIDAALIAQTGSAQIFYYGTVKPSPSTITVFGSIMTFGQWTWSWVTSGETVISGYENTVSSYDGNLLYGPPPSFPLSASGYQQLNWMSN